MSIFSRLLPNYKRNNTNRQHGDSRNKSGDSPATPSTNEAYFDIVPATPRSGDSYLYNAWVNIAVNILIRNIARAGFVIKKGGNEVTGGPLYDLFKRPNTRLSRYDLWKETAAWWSLEGETFWWFSPEYTGGLPKELYVLNPRLLHHEGYGSGERYNGVTHTARRWFYRTGTELIPILQDELIHFRDWNPWNPVRGVNPLIPVALELEQDYYASQQPPPKVGA
jgi:phage portal protein BeeE